MNELQTSLVEKFTIPAYIWKTGRTFYLSKKEWIVAEAYLRSRDYKECSRALDKEGFKKSWWTCERWLNKVHVRDYLKEKFEERSIFSAWTKEHWMKVVNDHLMGIKRLANGDLYAMRLIGQIKGWEAQPDISLVQSINILQADGMP